MTEVGQNNKDKAEDAKKRADEMRKELTFSFKNLWNPENEEEMKAIMDFCEDYKVALDEGKTEREFVDYSVNLLDKNGFKPFDPCLLYTSLYGIPLAVLTSFVVHQAIGLAIEFSFRIPYLTFFLSAVAVTVIIMLIINLGSRKAVSYTHLDVYKRQTWI